MKKYYVKVVEDCDVCKGTGDGKDKIILPIPHGSMKYHYKYGCGNCNTTGKIEIDIELEYAIQDLLKTRGEFSVW